MSSLALDYGLFVLDRSGTQIEDQIERLVDWDEWLERWDVEAFVPLNLAGALLDEGSPTYARDIEEVLRRIGSHFTASDVETVLWRLITTSTELVLLQPIEATVELAPPVASHDPCHPPRIAALSEIFVEQIALASHDNLLFLAIVTCPACAAVGADRCAIEGADGSTTHIELAVAASEDQLATVRPTPPIWPILEGEYELAIRLEAIDLLRATAGAGELPRFVLSPNFFSTLRETGLMTNATTARQLTRACAEAVVGHTPTEHHRLRTSSGGGAGFVEFDGRFFMRRNINIASGTRVHYWEARGNSPLEFSTVGQHDDINAPAPIAHIT